MFSMNKNPMLIGRSNTMPDHKSTLLTKLTEYMGGIASIWFFALVAIICTEVIAREFFSAPIRGITEISAYSLVGATFLQIANSIRKDRMTRVELIKNFLRKKSVTLQYSLEAMVSITGAIVMFLIARAAWSKLQNAFLESELVGVPGEFSFVVWPLRLLVLFGSSAAVAVFIYQIYEKYLFIDVVARERVAVLSAIILFGCTVLGVLCFNELMSLSLSNFTIGGLAILFLIILVSFGLHVFIALILVGFLGLWLIKGRITLSFVMLGISANEFLANYYFTAVPLFILMGLLVAASDIGKETFIVARWMTKSITGGLGIAIVGANTLFAAITGSSIASASVFSKIATPELMKSGYTKRFSVGVVAGSSVLGMLIPPSLLLIVYGFLAEQSVGKLFIAALVPGLILASSMCLMIWLRAKISPDSIFNNTKKPTQLRGQQDLNVVAAAILLLPIFGLIILVLGGIYGGLYTPTEGGAVGAAGALLYGIARGRLNLRNLWALMVETGQIATTVLFLIMSANIFTVMLASSGFVQSVGALINGLGLTLWQFAMIYALLLIFLGMFLESISIMLIMVPIALPTVIVLGGDPIWFGVLTVIAVEIGLLTPPFGMCCYVVSSALKDTDISLSDIFIGALPFVAVMVLITLSLICFPFLGAITTLL